MFGALVMKRREAFAKIRKGFTLLEILLALGLIAILTGVLVSLSINLTDTKPATPEEVFWKAVAETRKQALLSGQDVRMRFVSKDKVNALVASGPTGEQRFPFAEEKELKVDFLSTTKGGSAVLVRSQLVETSTVPYVTFYGDGTCSPFRAQFRTGGPARTVAIDPWTCAEVIVAGGPTR